MPGNRRSIRLKGYDYTRGGVYYVTICVNNRKCVFGDVRDGKMVLNDAGKMVDKWWRELTKKYVAIEIDEYIIMPNHFHGIIIIVGADLCVRPDNGNDINVVKGRTHRCAPTPTVGTIIQ
ncbi:MAG: transposase, partial [Candidatus Omnitrophota bacterium]